ncbi:relaxase/mobilization nuclease domain-containing protein [Endozoicomonas lisbonensis]|uniref:MobA/VirD2-like nuclease domain-containing protein n=1 Tax=Endozoicomonas lisbonensis TaxID=3120522 RepID=A0ABV2SL92_9GAMM
MKSMIMRHDNLHSHTKYYLDEEIVRHGFVLLEITCGNVCGRNAYEISKEFSDLHNTRPDTRNPIIACVLSLPPGEKCNDETWGLIVREFIRQMETNPDEHLWFGVRHKNTLQDHLHIEISRIKFSGKIWNPRFELIKAALAASRLEKQFNLTPTTPMVEVGKGKKLVFNNKSQQRKPSRSMMTKAGLNKTPLEIIQDEIDHLLKIKNGIKKIVFEKLLRRKGIIPVPNIRNKKLVGYRFTYGKHSFKGSELGTNYKLKELISRGLIINSDENPIETIKKNITSNPKPASLPSQTNNPEDKKAVPTKPINKTKTLTERNRQNYYKRKSKHQKVDSIPAEK